MTVFLIVLIAVVILAFNAVAWDAHRSSKVDVERRVAEVRAQCDASVIAVTKNAMVTATQIANKEVRELADKQAEIRFKEWVAEHTATERADAIKQSNRVNRGLITEQLAPFLDGFSYNPKDAHFIGNPIDYIIFDGLHDGDLKAIVLMEVKTGSARNNQRENQVKKAIQELRVVYETLRPEKGKSDFIYQHGTDTAPGILKNVIVDGEVKHQFVVSSQKAQIVPE